MCCWWTVVRTWSTTLGGYAGITTKSNCTVAHITQLDLFIFTWNKNNNLYYYYYYYFKWLHIYVRFTSIICRLFNYYRSPNLKERKVCPKNEQIMRLFQGDKTKILPLIFHTQGNNINWYILGQLQIVLLGVMWLRLQGLDHHLNRAVNLRLRAWKKLEFQLVILLTKSSCLLLFYDFFTLEKKNFP